MVLKDLWQSHIKYCHFLFIICIVTAITMKTKARLIAYYLPQFHPIPENDKWWGKGFTEWTNTAKAKPLFRGHYQPHIPADLSFYDLRVPETRAEQAEMARNHGIEGFCYYHYWFGGKQLLERPFDEVLASGEPDFPFCLCWANSTWSGIWHGSPNKTLIKQTYPGEDDHNAHFRYLLKAFADDRYITVDGMPLLLIYRVWEIPDVKRVFNSWREMAIKAGLQGIYLVGVNPNMMSWTPEEYGLDASTTIRHPPLREWGAWQEPLKRLKCFYAEKMGHPTVYSYEKVLPNLLRETVPPFEDYPNVIHSWDNSPRSGKNALVLHNSTPDLFKIHLKKALELVIDKPAEKKLLFLKSWNEWAEGNHLEPDIKYGKQFLEVIRDSVVGG